MADAIVARGVGKRFQRYHLDRPKTLKEALIRGFRRTPADRFWALRDVTFSVASGRMVGIIGGNGSGKSTLLRMISGVVRPNEGSIEVSGKIGALIDIGTGFHPDLTGRENVFIAGVLSGLTRSEVAREFDSIVNFAELEQFIDSPLRTYSSGMQMRLAFAVAVHTAPTILLIDEMLSVGDVAFQHKCLQQIRQFKEKGCAIVLVSHDPGLIKEICEEALWLRHGQVQARGKPQAVVEEYLAEILSESRRRTPSSWPVLQTPAGTELRVHENRFGSLEMEIQSVQLLNSKGLPVTEINSGDALRVEINYLAPRPIASPAFCVSIKREEGLICSDTNTESTGLVLPTLMGSGRIAVHFGRLDLVGGLYDISVAAYERNWSYAYDFHEHVYPLLVRPTESDKGILRPPHRWEFGDSGESQSTELGRLKTATGARVTG